MRIIRVRYHDVSFYAALGSENTIQCLQTTLGFNDPIPLSDIKILPLVSPSKVICIDLNYREKIQKLHIPIPTTPSFFLRPPSCIIGNGQPIIIPPKIGPIESGAELCIVIGQTCYNISPEAASNYIFGYTCANDITAKKIQETEHIQGHSKSYNTFCPVGPWIETDVQNIEELQIKSVINSELKQIGTTADMLFPPRNLVSFLSQIMTLNPGDIILAGNTSKPSTVKVGDIIQIEIDNIGILFNPVEDDSTIETIVQ